MTRFERSGRRTVIIGAVIVLGLAIAWLLGWEPPK